MTDTGAIPDKWGGEAMNPTVEFFHSAVRKLVAERFAASGKTWEEAVTDPSLELTREDFADIESQMLATGYRFEASAQVSAVEEPDKDGWWWVPGTTSSVPRATSPVRPGSSAPSTS
jgi:hypothetical protein